jgi:hypothetical protein
MRSRWNFEEKKEIVMGECVMRRKELMREVLSAIT